MATRFLAVPIVDDTTPDETVNLTLSEPAGCASLGLGADFGSGGMVTTGLAGGARAMALQSDGKMVLLGKRTLARYNIDGSVDTSFGTGGKVSIVFNGGLLDEAQGLAIQPRRQDRGRGLHPRQHAR